MLGTLLVCAVGALSYIALDGQLENRARERLRGELERARHMIAEERDAEAIREDAHRLADLAIGHDELHIAVARHGESEPLASFSLIARESLRRAAQDASPDRYHNWRSAEGVRLLSLAAAAETRSGAPVTIVATLDRRSDDVLKSALLRQALSALPAALALVAMAAWWITWRGLAPLQRLRRAVAHVTTRDLSDRIDQRLLPQELAALAKSFNAMLGRLEDGVARLSQFAGDLAHEMRTPISNLLGKTQVALTKSRATEEYRAVLESNVEEFERLARLVDDMLFLAQADNAKAALQPERLDLNAEAARVLEFLGLLADERRITLRVEGAAAIDGDRVMVQRAILNLVSNALRHTPAGGAITLRIAQADAGTTLAVSNTGAPIAEQHLPHVFERFYRADTNRSRAGGGAGLGLAIVMAIMKLHGGDAQAENAGPGEVTFRLTFPPRACTRRETHV